MVRVDRDGRLTLDSSQTMASYRVRVGRQEYVTKYAYDAAAAMEYLVTNADEYSSMVWTCTE
eukprot:5464267-Prymnesium_polylepis.2